MCMLINDTQNSAGCHAYKCQGKLTKECPPSVGIHIHFNMFMSTGVRRYFDVTVEEFYFNKSYKVFELSF